jgi:hypothetical protein
MKLLITTCLKEYQDDVSALFKQANIGVFSVTDITGFKDDNSNSLPDGWFASGEEKFDSLLVFSFTSNANAEAGINLINDYNKKLKKNFPVRAFIVPVDKSTNHEKT